MPGRRIFKTFRQFLLQVIHVVNPERNTTIIFDQLQATARQESMTYGRPRGNLFGHALELTPQGGA